ncbi:MAG: hypothetical protein V2I48_08165 [Xanthomonadales bacterium]|jgi:hypothetical protein|nr:hypothetical protein [Xanthomonadales bacterium]
MKITAKWVFSALVALLLLAVLSWDQLGKPLLFDLFQAVTGHQKLAANTFRMPPANTPYDQWMEKARAQIPVFEGVVIQDVRSVKLEPWPELGPDIRGMYLRFSDYQMSDGRIVELPAHAQALEQRHFFEMAIYAFGGPGHTIIQQEGYPPQRIDWDYRSLISIPLNAHYQHFNDSDHAVRLFAVSSFPFVINSFPSERFVFDNDFAMTDRYAAEAGYFEHETRVNDNTLRKNFVADALQAETSQQAHRTEGATGMRWIMSENSMLSARVSEMEAGMYKEAHRHSSDAFILLLSGEGYSLTWLEGLYGKRLRVDWHEGTLFVPPIYWYHQHFNPGGEPARYLAINTPYLVQNLGLRFIDQLKKDLPEVKKEWEQEREKRARNSQK